ncbi:MAG: V-type ATP synthase subunit I [Eubacteriaceae bacterium]
MAIENVIMMDVVGKISYVDDFARDMFLFNDIQIVDAMHEIDIGRFILPIREENMGELLGFAQLVSGEAMMDEKNFLRIIDKMDKLYQNSLKLDMLAIAEKPCDLKKAMDKLKEFETVMGKEYAALQEMENTLKALEKSWTAYSYLDGLEVDMAELDGMENFSYQIGSVTKDNASRLKSIYNSVTSIVFHVGNTEDGNEEVFVIISPKDLEIESARILKALNFKTIEGFDAKYNRSPIENLKLIKAEISELEVKYRKLSHSLSKQLEENRDSAIETYNTIGLFANLSVIKKSMAFSDENFYFSGWISAKDKQKMEKMLSRYPDIIVMFSDPKDRTGKTPTKLKNNWMIKPFENLVKMYGVPSYHEIDPTPFLSISYLLCFGFMFGDVGQGMVMALGGFILGRKGVELGKVLVRLGLVASFFGFMYGSIFGNEELLTPLWVSPFHDENTVLTTGVIIGIGMLLIAYIYSIANKLKVRDYKEGLFGKNGLCGFILYTSLLALAGLNLTGMAIAQSLNPILIFIAVVMVFVVLIREPLVNAFIYHKPLYDEGASDYYVESGFELFEMLLAMLSNTLSFIRVGAFALTHVGLFMAFQTLAIMVHNQLIGAGILIFANVLIIGLEGLIVFIQALRLQFYELFSKYYTGDGVEFIPVRLQINLF